jgi:hypothetical protein
VTFLPAISDKAAQAMRETIRDWRLAATRNNQSLEEIAGLVNPSVRGWANYYGRFYRSAPTPVLGCLERALVKWAQPKYKRLRRHATNAAHRRGRVSRRDPNLLVLWQIGNRTRRPKPSGPPRGRPLGSSPPGSPFPHRRGPSSVR